MIPIITCTLGSPSLEVMKKSIEIYSPDTQFIIHQVERSSFGECFNKALEEAFQTHDGVIMANDDVVITPTTIPLLLEDIQLLKQEIGDKLGFVATLSDNTRPPQTIRVPFLYDDIVYQCKWVSEHRIRYAEVIAPIFAYISKQAFQDAQFPPINWWSDDVICEDLNRLGYKHFVSRAYIHHVGSSTIGHDYEKLKNEALPWVQKNRPDYIQLFTSREAK